MCSLYKEMNIHIMSSRYAQLIAKKSVPRLSKSGSY